MKPIELLKARLRNATGFEPKDDGNGCVARCPGPTHANGDRNPSLHISENEKGDALVNCFVGCTTRP